MSLDNDKIEKLKKALYSKTAPDIIVRKKTPLHEKNYSVAPDWKHTQRPEDPVSFEAAPPRRSTLFIGLLAFAIVFFVSALLFAGFIFSRGGNSVSADNVDILVGGPVQIGGGEVLSLDVTVSNNNPTKIELADLAIEYPDGTKQVNNIKLDLKRTREFIGDIAPSGAIKKSLKAVLFGEENSKQTIKINLEYRIAGSSAIFQKQKVFELFLSSAPVSVSVDGVDEISSNQQTQFKVTVSSNSTTVIPDFVLRADYPFGFIYKEASPQPLFDNNTWDLGSLQPQQKKTILITGTIQGQNEEERTFRFTGGAPDPDNKKQISTVVVTKTKTVSIKKPFLGTELVFDSQPTLNYVGTSGKIIRLDITFTNNTPTKIVNGVIKARITGPALDKSMVSVQDGFYDSSSDTVTWSAENLSALKEIAPGASGRVTMSFASKGIGQNITAYKNPQIDIGVNVSGEQSSITNVPQSIESDAVANVKIASDIGLTSRSVYSIGPFTNTGPLPPKVDKQTTYTIVWTIINGTNAVNGAQVTATLPSYVKWVGTVSPTNEHVTYNPTGGTVTWDVGSVPAGIGYSSPQREVSFQVSFTPSLSQLGSSPTLVNQAAFSGTDTFTGTAVTDSAQPVSTRIFSDPNAGLNNDQVEN